MLLRLLPWFLFRRGHVMLLLHHLRINLASPLVDHPIISTICVSSTHRIVQIVQIRAE